MHWKGCGGIIMIWARMVLTVCSTVLLLFGAIPAKQALAISPSPDPIYRQAKSISTFINHKDWEKAIQKSDELKKLYQDNRWKYQLLGDEGEYEELNREIDRLRAAVKEKDRKQANIMIAAILSILEEIYSM